MSNVIQHNIDFPYIFSITLEIISIKNTRTCENTLKINVPTIIFHFPSHNINITLIIFIFNWIFWEIFQENHDFPNYQLERKLNFIFCPVQYSYWIMELKQFRFITHLFHSSSFTGALPQRLNSHTKKNCPFSVVERRDKTKT